MTVTPTAGPHRMNPLRTGAHVIESDGIRLRYHVHGSGSEVLVALPGGPGLWRPICSGTAAVATSRSATRYGGRNG